MLAVLALATPACDGGGGDGGSTDRVAGVYLAVLRWAVDEAAGSVPTTEPAHDPPVVYAWGLDGRAIPAAVQVVVVKDARDELNVRFADAREEAIDDDEVGEPVHDDGLLVSLGTVPEAGDELTMEAEVYRDLDHDLAFELQLRVSDEGWRVVAATRR